MPRSVYVSGPTLEKAIRQCFGTADHLLKIWLTLKQMGMAPDRPPVSIDTASPTPALKRLFGFGDPEENFFTPFAHTTRFLTMKHDAARSIIQTNIRRWLSSGSVVGCDPTGYIKIEEIADKLLVSPGRPYPLGLGFGPNGFALDDNVRVSLPAVAFSVWYGRQTEIPSGENPEKFLLQQMRSSLNLTDAEFEAIFVDKELSITTTATQLSDRDVFRICQKILENNLEPITAVLPETFERHAARIRTMVTVDERPSWLRQSPSQLLKQAIDDGAKAVLLYGPPRTGKTRAIDALFPRDGGKRETIQIHDGWGYDNLIQGFRPDASGKWDWRPGVLHQALSGGKKVIVLEELNRTQITQALGEVFSLIEEAYRGSKHGISLRNGSKFFIPEDVLFLMTINTLDKSTEDLDDALVGRFRAIEFPPRIEDLGEILKLNDVSAPLAEKVRALFVAILEVYPLGPGYFSSLKKDTDVLAYYMTRIRPVILMHFQNYKPEIVTTIDSKVDELFAK